MGLIKTSILSFISVVIKMVTLLGINKVLAIYVGPAGYASFGQFQNVIQMMSLIGSGGINNGIVKYTAEIDGEREKFDNFLKTAIVLSLFFTISVSIVISFFSSKLSLYFLHDENLYYIFLIFSISVFFIVINNALLSILNGKREIKKYVIANIFGSIFSLLLTYTLTVNFKIVGALISLCTYQSLTLVVTIFIIFKSDIITKKTFKAKVDKVYIKKLLSYSFMSLTSAVVLPLTLISLRDLIGNNISWVDAGYWESAWRLSSAYVLLISTTFSVYFLPKFSLAKNRIELRREVFKGYKFIIPLAIIGAFILLEFKDIIVTLLFSESFLPVSNILLFQIMGDFVKVCSVLLGYIFVSKSLTTEYIISEILFCIVFYLLSYFLIEIYGLQGVTISYFITYIFHLFLVFYLLKRKEVI